MYYMLDYLFHRCAWKDNMAFKGGTSLSKAYGLIVRFFEDIDLIFDWRVLGYGIMSRGKYVAIQGVVLQGWKRKLIHFHKIR